MSDQLFGALNISANGMRAQSTRVRVVSENLANANTAATAPGEQPYQRQVVTFKNIMDRKVGFKTVQVDEIQPDSKKPFPLKYMPDHPGANEDGYVMMPNVDTLIETMDMREAQRSYEANLGMLDQSKSMMMSTISILSR
jgi:flagellar basal-body rod protein FlgC